MKRNLLAGLAIVPVALALGAGIAHADNAQDEEYIELLRADGVFAFPDQGTESFGELGHVVCERLYTVLPGTQNEHDGVTFDEHEQPVVGVHADAMVFTLTAGRLMSCSW